MKGDRVGARRVAAPNSKDTQGVLAPSHFKKRKKTRLSAQQWGPSHGCLLHMEHRKTLTSETHSAVRLNLGSFHGNGNAVQENDHQDDVIKHLVSDDFIAHQTESVERGKKKSRHRLAINARLAGETCSSSTHSRGIERSACKADELQSPNPLPGRAAR